MLPEVIAWRCGVGRRRSSWGFIAYEDLPGAPMVSEDLWRRASDGGCANALFNLALLARERGDRAGEVRWLTAAVGAGVTKALVNLGCIAHGEGDLGRALSWYRRALEHHPDMAAFNLGVIYRDLGETDTARSWFLQAAEAFNVNALEELEALDDSDKDD